MDRAVAYYRVSTWQQQRSELGIEAQRAAVERFAEAENLTIIAELVEAETGKGAEALGAGPGSSLRLATDRQVHQVAIPQFLQDLSQLAMQP